jgi:protein-tyrosine-phosphatase
MAERGLDISDHRAHELTAEDVTEADLILVMTRYHKEAILAEFPEARDKTFLLSEMAGKGFDIADPYGQALMNYHYCATELEDLIEEGYQEILKRAQEDV